MYAIETKDGPKAKWKPSGRRYMTRTAAIEMAADLDEHGSCVCRVVNQDNGCIVWTPRTGEVVEG